MNHEELSRLLQLDLLLDPENAASYWEFLGPKEYVPLRYPLEMITPDNWKMWRRKPDAPDWDTELSEKEVRECDELLEGFKFGQFRGKPKALADLTGSSIIYLRLWLNKMK